VAKAESIGTEARDLMDLVVAYAKQETIDPLKKTAKHAAFGVLGGILTGIGVIFLGIALLRGLQTETDAFNAYLSWLPYLIVMFVLMIGALLSWKAIRGPEPGEAKAGAKRK
jgi:ABC-type amino acid transport system permease subunit